MPTVVTVSQFLADPRYAGFDTFDEDLISVYLDDAEQDTLNPGWGTTLRVRGIKLLVAHWLTLGNATAADGMAPQNVSSISSSQGSQSLSYADFTTENNAFLEATIYGREYLKLRKRLPVTGYVV
jgi:hypothetical protein